MDNGRDEEWAYFLERMIHDLREPLRSIHSFSELLAAGVSGRAAAVDPEWDRRILSEIAGGAETMRTLVDGLSGYAMALHGPEGTPASLQLAFNMTLMTLDRQIQACDATISGEGLPRVGVKLERLAQLLENLISNSLLFRSDAPPSVEVSARAEDSGWWLVELRDNGMGIEPGQCETIFKPFTRLHGRKFPGAGLGLAICRKIVESHGGAIRMESRPGNGSACYFTLPPAE